MHPAPTRWPRRSVGSAQSHRVGCWLGFLAWAALLLLAGPVARAGEPLPGEATEDEYKVKAAFLYHFIRYTTWLAEAFEDERAPILVLVVGEDPFGSRLRAALVDKVVAGRPIQVLHSPEVPPQIGAHVVFAGYLGKTDTERPLGLCRGRPVLLLGSPRATRSRARAETWIGGRGP